MGQKENVYNKSIPLESNFGSQGIRSLKNLVLQKYLVVFLIYESPQKFNVPVGLLQDFHIV